jgi:hypothetical protein
MSSPHYVDHVVRRTATMATLVLGLVVFATSGCGVFGNDDAADTDARMRPVPTIASGDGALPGAGASAPTATELVGDPQPDPDSPDTLPPLPDQPVINACERLNELATADVIGTAVGTRVAVESIWDEACRFTAGGAVAEVHYVSEATVETDWFRRDAIEPVGAVTGDAVGVAEFAPPGSEPAAGYTIALISRRQGAVIAVRGTGDDRAIAEQLASIVEGSI